MPTWNTETIINHFIRYVTKVTAFIVPNQTQDTVYCFRESTLVYGCHIDYRVNPICTHFFILP